MKLKLMKLRADGRLDGPYCRVFLEDGTELTGVQGIAVGGDMVWLDHPTKCVISELMLTLSDVELEIVKEPPSK